jgi:hypothetical protein
VVFGGARGADTVSERVVEIRRTFRAKLFEVVYGKSKFAIAGTLDGFIDLALPQGGTYPLTIDEASALAQALNGSVVDLKKNCLYDKDALLIKNDTC